MIDRLGREDPTFKVHTNPDTGQLIISGMGELHLEVIKHRMLNDFNLEANVGRPRVTYRETIKKAVEVEGRFIKQTGGHGQFAVIDMKVEPLTGSETHLEIVDKVTGGDIPKEYVEAVKEGIRDACSTGAVTGYPLTELKVTILGGKTHAVGSSELAFEMAANLAIQQALEKGGADILEPLMRVEVATPENYMGDVIGDLNARRGSIQEIRTHGNQRVIEAEVPLANMFGYASDVRSLTQGHASFTMEPSRYAAVPSDIYDKLVDEYYWDAPRGLQHPVESCYAGRTSPSRELTEE